MKETDGDFAPRAMVLAPITVLSIIFAATAGAILIDRLMNFASNWVILAIGAAIFALAVALLARRGLGQMQHLELLSQTDSLTGLPNRRALHAEFQRRSVKGPEMAVALIDLDGFLLVNEQHGHGVGDMAIQECSAILGEICKKEAKVFRLGGDEFALMKSGPLAGTLLEGLCRKVVERLSRPVHVEERRLSLGASIGLVRSAEDELISSSEMLRRADVAMYASKRGGKSRCTWFSQDFDASRDQLRELDSELRTALANEEFRLEYQPLVDCRTRHVVAVEALLRWPRADGNQMGPSLFIPVAEDSGLINPIGLWVLRRACRDAMGWDQIKLSVNISAAQLRNPEFPIQLGHILEETGFDPARLELEITETSIVLDPLVAERSLSVIRGFGVNVVLDDFGTGYASIGFLRQFRFEKLKLDRSLVVQAGEDDASRAMMLSSITVARAMQMNVTAEGVETSAQADMVRAAGCDQIQGWLYFRSMPACEISQYLGRPIDPPSPTMHHEPQLEAVSARG